MEAINALIRRAEEHQLLTPLGQTAVKNRVFIYADDLVIFLKPTEKDLKLIRAVLNLFAEATGLETNVNKCQFSPIRCTDEDIALVQQFFLCQLQHFPCKYLGAPLSIYKLKKEDLQPLVDSVGDRLPTWKAGLLNRAGRVALTKATLSAIPIHLSISVGLPPWTIRAIDKFRKGFVWSGTPAVSGGRCLVAWQKVCRPVDLGGLGILDLSKHSYALSLLWQWLRRTDSSRTWASLPAQIDPVVQQLFDISVTVDIGDGAKTLFWLDHWIHGKCIQQLAPNVFQAVPKRIQKSRTVMEGLANGSWIRDIQGARTFPLIRDFLLLLGRLESINTTPNREDRFIWRWSATGEYSPSSAYRILFNGQFAIQGAKELHKTRAPARSKFFFWLVLLGRCWTSDRLQRHNLQHNGPRALCVQLTETLDHLLLGCVFSRQIWYNLLRNVGHQILTPTADSAIVDWWLTARKRIPKAHRKGFDSLVVLVTWEVWKERNRRVFQRTSRNVMELLTTIQEVGRNWIMAGFRALSDFIQ
ncbi:hypothetical protein PR202_ga29462 [Eleusine coracana subsp. coracana]|uniref:Reverse transcriptase zinc-binding domain-containing protein n=1 Tax=Eleusine coracana subsp. coracana TaxID=191504 RepID=A0AAV5DLA3_ELECO|nr:hypothetical protein PR202_ga29462 [Eleusine coracana subsp. coracana]